MASGQRQKCFGKEGRHYAIHRIDRFKEGIPRWDVVVTFMLMMFGAFTVIAFGAILIWALYLIQKGVDDE